MITNIKPWGNSQGLYIPKSMLKEAGFAVNESVELLVQDGDIVIKKNKNLNEKALAFKRLNELRHKGLNCDELDYREEYYKYLDERYQV